MTGFGTAACHPERRRWAQSGENTLGRLPTDRLLTSWWDSCPLCGVCRRGSRLKRTVPVALGTTQNQTSAAISIRRVAELSRNVGQPDHILGNPIICHEAERRPGSGEIWLAVAKHDGVQVDSILIDQAKFG